MHTRAVFAAFREILPDQELRDLADQPPRDYDAPPPARLHCELVA